MLLRCSLATDVVGASDWDERCTNQLHHFYCDGIRCWNKLLVDAILDSQIQDFKLYQALCERVFFRIFIIRERG